MSSNPWREEAVRFIQSQNWSVKEIKFNELVLVTGAYLKRVSEMKSDENMKYPCYVVHDMDTEFRMVCVTHTAARAAFKRSAKDGNRVAIFHYDEWSNQKRLQATVGYSLTRDFRPMEEYK